MCKAKLAQTLTQIDVDQYVIYTVPNLPLFLRIVLTYEIYATMCVQKYSTIQYDGVIIFRL